MTCRAYAAFCRCKEAEGHEPPHVCACGGSWEDDGTVHAWPHTDPGSGLTAETMAAADDAFAAEVAARPKLPYRDPLLRPGYHVRHG